MSESFKNLLKESFADITKITPEKLKLVVDETLKYFQSMQERLNSKEPGVREAALAESLEVRELLEKQMLALCVATGLDPAQMTSLAEEALRSNPKDRAVVEEMKTKLRAMGTQGSGDAAIKHRPKLKIKG